VPFHYLQGQPDGLRHCLDGIVGEALAQCEEKQCLTIGGSLSEVKAFLSNKRLEVLPAGRPITNVSVVHKRPVPPYERMAVGAIHSGAGRCSNMGKEHLGAYMPRKRTKIAVIPGGENILEEPCAGSPIGVPSHSEAVAVGNPSRLLRR